ncbi:uncharacterized protein DFL_001645 [Arthrobotrys flagrans]|uniref:Xaa-Pro aminopeptidase n=1 Tax=Arthrobotrys flagrans TaxID=97331 RepID=A0A437A872_ARTFL|nr:hypothetical protein DFL_001645 [Arthrobotrys flagrans]
MQRTVFSMLKPGVKWRDCHFAAVDVAIEGLREIGVLVGEKGIYWLRRFWESNGDGGMRKRRRRGGGVMALEDFDAFTKDETYNHLKPGMTLTVEPGIYFNQPLYEDYLSTYPHGKSFVDETVLSKYWDVGGVRIEDVVLITEDGYENLTPAPKEIVDIERITGCGKSVI